MPLVTDLIEAKLTNPTLPHLATRSLSYSSKNLDRSAQLTIEDRCRSALQPKRDVDNPAPACSAIPGIMWALIDRAMVGEEWPSISDTTFTGTEVAVHAFG
jgi:hypothetical protein